MRTSALRFSSISRFWNCVRVYARVWVCMPGKSTFSSIGRASAMSLALNSPLEHEFQALNSLSLSVMTVGDRVLEFELAPEATLIFPGLLSLIVQDLSLVVVSRSDLLLLSTRVAVFDVAESLLLCHLTAFVQLRDARHLVCVRTITSGQKLPKSTVYVEGHSTRGRLSGGVCAPNSSWTEGDRTTEAKASQYDV
eukprot:IDg6277t1